MKRRATPRASRPARNWHGLNQRTAKRSVRLDQDAASQQGSLMGRLALQITRWLIVFIFAVAIGSVVLTALRDQSSLWPAASGQTDKRIGIISGHRGHDSGAVCDDGLTEAEVNFRHATRVADLLRAHGYQVDVLDEYDVRLTGYRARAVVSIHADSCARINTLATGFKVAHPATSEASKQLAACLRSRYAQRTGLSFHARSITRDMTNYYAFSRVAPQTPIAIIETGFLFLDRPLLVRHPEIVAQGIAEGVLCFLRDELPAD
jgi:N-acetylmuramoyl-L-alanine amidase